MHNWFGIFTYVGTWGQFYVPRVNLRLKTQPPYVDTHKP
jgi:hypothetical protein